eukprot:jgi/Mesvir1/18722/Mv25597-RA.1
MRIRDDSAASGSSSRQPHAVAPYHDNVRQEKNKAVQNEGKMSRPVSSSVVLSRSCKPHHVAGKHAPLVRQSPVPRTRQTARPCQAAAGNDEIQVRDNSVGSNAMCM